ncbi:necrosis and ethylene inducing peptide [Fusarium venenatum]|uniref:necrosis and ethylene inducing peptide n=1 Tax=Fusarium venenatum TaxID=56646 RepID=UPI001D1BC5FF|nr:necrosis and ethylene inducing peptide [Fusarium venenatum]
MHPQTIFSAFLALAATGMTAPSEALNNLQARATVNHDSLNPVGKTIQGGAIGAAIDRWQPLLHIAHGCQPYTAVATNGDVSGGLQDSGTTSGGCRDTGKGQTYARAALHNGKLAIMYAWYWPKDQPADGNLVSGHRHDWENVVVFIDNYQSPGATLYAAAASGHGSYKKTKNPQRNGNNVMAEYFTSGGKNHELQFKTSPGRTYWIYDWAAMTPAARTGLVNGPNGKPNDGWGSANVPFIDANFGRNIGNAWS